MGDPTLDSVGLSIVERPTPEDDAEIVAACIAGDVAAQRALFRREYPRVNATVFRLVGSARDADDLVQETFIAVFRGLARFRGDSKLSTWIDRIAVRVVFHHIRSRGRAPIPLDLIGDVEGVGGTTDAQAHARDGLRRFYAALADLTPEARTAFALFAIDGRSICGGCEVDPDVVCRGEVPHLARSSRDHEEGEGRPRACGVGEGRRRMKRIEVDPPVSEARRERVERQLFAQLAAVRVADRADAVIPRPKRSRATFAYAVAAAAAAVAIVLFVTRGGEPGGQTAPSPSRVVTPVGGESRFMIGREAVIDAKSDTSVEWQQTSDGGITLVLARGSVDCQVEPRHGRPPFKVVSGDVTVVVVGTRFTVTRTPSPRVDVAHGKVRVEAPGGTWFVEAGESWSPTTTAAIEPASVPEAAPAADPAPEIEMAPVQVPRAKKATAPAAPAEKSTIDPPSTRELAKEAYRAAQRLENTDPKLAAANYRAIARGKDEGWAATALVALAELSLKQNDPQGALEALDEHAKKFAHSPMREDAAWFRIEALRTMGKRDEARGAAADYLREFPDGVYAKPAARLVK